MQIMLHEAAVIKWKRKVTEASVGKRLAGEKAETFTKSAVTIYKV
jgi:hypothetical protein